jgi:hypothetical protein
MIWKIIALLGSGSFFFVGWGVLTDPYCNSVSFRGGGARTVLTTCYPDSRGDFSKVSAVTGSWLIGLAILGILFWPTIRVLINNYQYNQKLAQVTKEYSSQEDEIEGVEQGLDQPSNLASSQIFNLKKKFRENKIISIVLVVVFIFGFYKVAAPKVSLLNPITCSSLKKQLKERDTIGREVWNQYQSEVSKLGITDVGLSYEIWYNQVGNVHRRAVQVISNDLEKYELGYSTPHCVNIPVLDYLKAQDEKALSIFSGKTPLDNGKYWSYGYGWPTGYRKGFIESSLFLKK